MLMLGRSMDAVNVEPCDARKRHLHCAYTDALKSDY
jgi:hypothetical protein